MVFEALGPEMCTFGFLELSCEAMAAFGRQGFTQQPENPKAKRAHFRLPRFKHQNSTIRHPERQKRAKWWREREKKSEILGGPAEGGPAEVQNPHQHQHRQKWRVEARVSVPEGGGPLSPGLGVQV